MDHDLEIALRHVLWLGGSACAGKTSVARRLAQRHGLRLYHCDGHCEAHRQRADPSRHARFLDLMDRPPEALFAPPPARQVEDLIGFYTDELPMMLEDLLALPRDQPLLVEGVGLLPEALADRLPMDAVHRRAVWLIATPGWRRRLHPRRGAVVDGPLGQCGDPSEAMERWLARDDGFAEWLAAGARRVGGRVLWAEGQDLDSLTEAVAHGLGLREGHETLDSEA